MISERTKAGLAAARARGVKLGNQELADANKAAPAARDASLETVLRELGGRSYREKPRLSTLTQALNRLSPL